MSWYYYARMARRAPTEAAPPPHPPTAALPAPRLSSWSQGSEDARCVEGGRDAGAVFISDICNCEWRGQRTWPVGSRGPAAAGVAHQQGGSPGRGAGCGRRVRGCRVGGSDRGAVYQSGSEVRTWQWGQGAGSVSPPRGFRQRRPSPA